MRSCLTRVGQTHQSLKIGGAAVVGGKLRAQNVLRQTDRTDLADLFLAELLDGGAAVVADEHEPLRLQTAERVVDRGPAQVEAGCDLQLGYAITRQQLHVENHLADLRVCDITLRNHEKNLFQRLLYSIKF